MSIPTSSDESNTSLSAYEKEIFGHLGARMQSYHSYMKQEFAEIYDRADGSFYKHGMSLTMFLHSALEFKKRKDLGYTDLHAHHTVEERSVFPILAKKMPSFRDDEQHRQSHKAIHDGLNALVALISRFRADPKTYSPIEMRACLDSFRDVLMRHLDEEVHDLRAENMCQYWTLDEVKNFPW